MFIVGESIHSLHYQFRVGRKIASAAILDVCNVIYKRLKNDYLKVMQCTIQQFPSSFVYIQEKHMVKSPVARALVQNINVKFVF